MTVTRVHGRSISGVPLVVGLAPVQVRHAIDPLSSAKGLSLGLIAALLLWYAIAALVGAF